MSKTRKSIDFATIYYVNSTTMFPSTVNVSKLGQNNAMTMTNIHAYIYHRTLLYYYDYYAKKSKSVCLLQYYLILMVIVTRHINVIYTIE